MFSKSKILIFIVVAVAIFVLPKIQEAQAAVAYDAASESDTGTTGATATFSWTHAGGASPRGVLIFVFNRNDPSGDDTSGVTYGGVNVPLVTGGVARDTTASTEGGSTQAYFLGSSIPTGNQTVQVTEGGTFTGAYAIAITVTAGGNTEYAGVITESENQALTEEAVDDGSPGTNSVRFAGILHGGNDDGPAGANSTSIYDIDFGAYNNSAYRETTAGQGSRPVGVTNATSDDVAAVYLAVREILPATRYWVGGLGNWNDTAHWAYTSGGATGAPVPTSTNEVYFDGSSGTGTATVNVAGAAKSLTATGYIGTLALSASLTVAENLTLVSGMTFTPNTNAVILSGSAGSFTLTSGTKSFYDLQINDSDTTWTLGDALNVSNNLTITLGTLQLSTLGITVTGATSITGTLSDNSATGTNLFVGAVTINNGGTWTTTNNPAFEFRGGLTVTATSTFTSGTGTYTFSSTNAQTISGTQAFTITNLANNVTTSTGLTFSGSNPTVTTLTQGASAQLTFSGTVPTITTLTATAAGNTVSYTLATGGQTVKGTTYVNLTLSNTSGTDTASGAITATTLNISNANAILDMATYALTVTTPNNSGTIKTQNTSVAPVTAGKTWGGTVEYNAATGSQKIMDGTYGILTLSNTSGTDTANNNIATTTLNISNANAILDMATYALTVTTPNNSGTIKTQNTSVAPVTAGKTWGGTVEYNAATGSQKIMDGTYGILTLSNTSGTDTANNTVSTTTLNISNASAILDMATYALTVTTPNNSGTIKTQNTSATPIPTGLSWGGTIQYDSAAAGQTVVTGTYTNLTLSNTNQTATLGGAIIVSNNLTINTNAGLDTGNTLNYAINVAGVWSNSGNFTARLGTVTLDNTTTVSGTTTFYNLTIDKTNTPTISFTSGTTQTIGGTFSSAGDATKQITIGATIASAATLSKASGIVSVSYTTISYSAATGGATWQAYTSNGNIDGNNNSGWQFSPPANPVFDQKHFRFYRDNGGLNSADFYASEDTNYNIGINTTFRLRIETANTGEAAGNITRRLEFKEDSGTWTQITTGTNNVRISGSANFADGDATTSRLTATGTFTAGQGKDAGSDTSQISLTNGYYTEDEYSLILQATAAGHSYQFRISNAGTALDTYTVTPAINTPDNTPPVASGFNPATSSTIRTAIPNITFTLNESGDCYASTTNNSYDNMVSGGATNCIGDGSAGISCLMASLGSNGSKTIYFACEDTWLNKDTIGTTDSVTYTLTASSTTANPSLKIKGSTLKIKGGVIVK